MSVFLDGWLAAEIDTCKTMRTHSAFADLIVSATWLIGYGEIHEIETLSMFWKLEAILSLQV